MSNKKNAATPVNRHCIVCTTTFPIGEHYKDRGGKVKYRHFTGSKKCADCRMEGVPISQDRLVDDPGWMESKRLRRRQYQANRRWESGVDDEIEGWKSVEATGKGLMRAVAAEAGQRRAGRLEGNPFQIQKVG